ncbi:MAG: hypothetical protein EWM47_02240 [Anaerolineaceae bacterium]|nr:MAG: hypothetical protein EWM47_02240 [Anaerolineaceae bacterium]
MKKVIRLVSVQLWAILGSMFAIGESKKKKTKALYVGFALFVVILSGASFFYAYMIGMGLKLYGSIDLLPSLFMALTSIIVLFTTIHKVKGTLFGFKDYDMVMSLPVSNSQIVASRLLLLYSINLVFVIIVMLPMMVAYGLLNGPRIQFYVFSILMLFFIPLIPIIIASFLGTILTYLSMRFKYSNIVYMAFSFLLLIAMIIMPYFLGNSEQALVEISQIINGQINSIYPLSELYSMGVTKGDLLSILIFIVVSILSFMVFSMAVGKVFKRINSTIMTGRYRANYKLERLKSSSPLKALYIKDLKRYFASIIYVMNTGFGVVILVLGSIALAFVDITTITGGLDITGTIRDMIPLFFTFCIATSCTTMASISIEGRHIWIIKNLPVSTLMIFASKILVNLTIIAPALLSSIFVGIILQIPFISVLLLLLAVVSFSLFMAQYGLVINLSFPNLSWSNETVIVKQSTASLISVFSGIGMTAIQYLLLMALGNAVSGMLLFIIILLILNLLLYKRLVKDGKRQFEKLSN